MKKTLIILITVLCATIAQAQDLYELGNQQYAEGNYQEAIETYQTLLDSDLHLGDEEAFVFYNLGNAYFRLNETGRAILNYERCLRMNPTFKDARYNLRFAQARIIDNIEDSHTFFLSQWIQSLRQQLKHTTWLWISVCLFMLSMIGILVFLFTKPIALRKTGFHTAWVALLLSLGSLALAISAYQERQDQTEAIVMQGIVNVKSAPDRSGTDLFVLHEGTKVRISDTVSGWVEIHVGDNIGWVREDAVERIVGVRTKKFEP